MKQVIAGLDMKDEAEIKILLSGIVDLIDLISINFSSNMRIYLIEHLILLIRELSFYSCRYFKNEIDIDMKEKIKNIKNIRDAICHRSSPNNWLKGNIKIQGALLFYTNGVMIQYGEYHIYLIEGVIDLFIKMQKMFLNPLSVYKIEEVRFIKSRETLVESIKQFKQNILDSSHSPL